MRIKSIDATTIKDSRGEPTIEIFIKTDVGNFRASAPNGKSKGKHEAKPYKKSLSEDIEMLKKLSDYFSEEYLENFEDLRRVEDIVRGHVGANTLFALESAVLKGISKEKKKEIWELVKSFYDPSSKLKKLKIPRFVGNCIGGGVHSETSKKPDFQEFLLIPKPNSAIESSEINFKGKFKAGKILLKKDKKFKEKRNDEHAWVTSLNEKEVLEILSELKIPIGFDSASSSFYKRKKYHYKNPPLDRTPQEQEGYLKNLIKNYSVFYVEDPFDEEDFEGFSRLLKETKNVLIVGDDLIVTNYKRLEKAIEMKSVNALIIKPNQNGSLLDVSRVVKLAKKNNIKTVFSHRSGETNESILADLAFGFQSDFIKLGIDGSERLAKINRLIEIEKSLKK